MAAVFAIGLAAGIVAPASDAGASGGTVTYTATVNIPAPPSSNFSGATTGDGWAVALTSTAVYNVFHHQQDLQVDCHLQADGSQSAPCWGGAVTITDSDGSAFYTSAQPGLYLNQSTGDLYVYAEHPEDDTAGVVCIDTNATLPASNIFCGYQPLTPAGQGPPTSANISGTSDPVQIGTNWYSFNYVNGTATGAEDELMCFSLTTFSACSGQPYAVSSGFSAFSDSPEPAPSIAAIGDEVVIPVADGGNTTLACYDTAVAGGSCGGSWPVATGISYEGNYGSPFPLLDGSTGATTGFCLPTGADPCWNLDGTSATTPAGMTSTTIPAETGWNGPAVVVGPRVYVANQDSTHSVFCFDYSSDAECSNFPINFSGINNGPYTVNTDPQRPDCIWINSDSGSSQIQNFDAFTAGSCGQGPIRIAASGFVAPASECTPTQWTSLQITAPSPPTVYGGGSVEFENNDGVALTGVGGANPATLDGTGSVNLTGYDFSSAAELPDFVVTFNSPPSDLSAVTIDVSWQAVNSSACSQSGTSVSGEVTLTGPTGSAPANTNQTLTATVTANDAPVSGAAVTFTCVQGPCTTATGNGTTNGSGEATFTYASTTPGTDVWEATYTPSGAQTETSGDGVVVWDFLAAASPSSTTYGNAVNLSESGLAEGATGTVTFSSDGDTLCTVTLPTTSCMTTSTLAPGAYPVTASYGGDSDNEASTATTAFSVSPASTTTGVTVDDATTTAPWSGSETPGAKAYATATVNPAATGTVTFELYANASCAGSPTQTTMKTLSAGAAGPSTTTAALATGTYSYQATYGGSADDAGSTSQCAAFSVGKSTPTLSNGGVFDHHTESPWSDTETTGAVAFDTATISGAAGFTPTGTVTYQLYAGGSCALPLLQSDTETLTGGNVPSSAATAPLAGGTYSYLASYSGDANYGTAESTCQQFTVAAADPIVTNSVDDAATSMGWSGSETTGAQAFDTSIVDGVDGFTPTGTVTYALYLGAGCTGSPLQTSTETLAGGVAPNSATSPDLLAAGGTYSYQAAYSGDSNYTALSSECAEITVGKGTPSVGNTVDDATTSTAWLGSEVTGATADDTSTVAGAPGVPATGTVTYSLYSGSSCAGDPLHSSVETLAGGVVPVSDVTASLAAGSYSYEASYSGNADYSSEDSSCVGFSVGHADLAAMGQVVDDATTSSPWTNAEATGATATDTSTVSGVGGYVPTGTVTYALYSGPSCAGEPLQSSTKTIGGGDVPNSATTTPLHAGSYSYQASYSGDGNFLTDASECDAFAVSKDIRIVGGVVYDGTSLQPWNGTEMLGAVAYETSTVNAGNDGVIPTGTVTYALYADDTCTGSALSHQTVTLTDTGAVPNSSNSAPLAAGEYGFVATYSGDSDYHGATGNCDPFSVDQSPSSTTEVVNDVATGAPWAGTEDQGAAADAAAAVNGTDGFVPTGTLSYSLFANGSCDGPAAGSQTVTLSGGVAPGSASTGALAPGTYSYLAVFNGDNNYFASTSACRSFSAGVVGYRLVGHDGGVFSFGAPFRGSILDLSVRPNNFVGMAATTDGYWLVQQNGGVFTFGGAQFYGSVVGMGLSIDDAVGIAPTPDGRGYWVATSDGTVYPFGDAVSHGTLPGMGIHVDDIVGIAAHGSGGYWLVGSDGGVFTFGDAQFYGSEVGHVLHGPVVGMTPSPDGSGYWLAGSDGGVFSFGDAPFHGSCLGAGSGCQGVSDVVGIAEADAGGYWLTASNGDVYNFGDAQFLGSENGVTLNGPIVGITRAPNPGS